MDIHALIETIDENFIITVWATKAVNEGGRHNLYHETRRDVRRGVLSRIVNDFRSKPITDGPWGHAALLVEEIAVNQPFSDCNHRTSLHMLLLFLAELGYSPSISDEELSDRILALSDVRRDQRAELTKWIRRSFRKSSQ